MLFYIAAINCGDPGTPTNGQRSLSSTTYNSVVTYTCDVGYTLQGSNSRTCQADGQWSGSAAQCLGTLCGRFGCLIYIISVFICRPPFFSAICTNPCQNGGTCTAPETCTCDVGWTGIQCETCEAMMEDQVHPFSASNQEKHIIIVWVSLFSVSGLAYLSLFDFFLQLLTVVTLVLPQMVNAVSLVQPTTL